MGGKYFLHFYLEGGDLPKFPALQIFFFVEGSRGEKIK